jgi:adenylate cyclase
MGEDEETTVRTITLYREVMAKLIRQHRGCVVDSPGDNLLAEFVSVVDAVQCAVEIQQDFRVRNAELPDDRKMEFRIGINLGDVIQAGERIYGDGVNIAARVEGLAEGGGICISGSAYDQVKNKLALGYESLGEHNVKNIAEPIRGYRVLMDPEAVGKVIGEKRVGPKWQGAASAAAAVVIFGALFAVIWNFHLRPAPPSEKVVSEERMVVQLPDKPSIAVLPFNNLSGDPEQEYFNDGITNDIITDISKFRELFVIASNTVFTYKGKPVNVKEVSQELGVRYVLEGSVQRAGENVRINAQLIDATTGHHLWAERYDRDLKDLFVVQDEIVQTIVTKLAVEINEAERARVMRKATESLEAYDYLLRGSEYFRRRTRSAMREARQMFEKAIELDPGYATAYAALGWYYFSNAGWGWTEFPAQALQQAEDLAHKALSLDQANAAAHRLLGYIYLYRTQYDFATSELQLAIELNPNDALSHRLLGSVMLYSGKIDDAIHSLESTISFDPSFTPGTVMELALAYYLKERYDDSIRILQRGLARRPDYVGHHIVLAAAYAQLDRSEDAAQEVATVLRLDPFFDVESYGSVFRNPADRAKIADGLRKTGLK